MILLLLELFHKTKSHISVNESVVSVWHFWLSVVLTVNVSTSVSGELLDTDIEFCTIITNFLNESRLFSGLLSNFILS